MSTPGVEPELIHPRASHGACSTPVNGQVCAREIGASSGWLAPTKAPGRRRP